LFAYAGLGPGQELIPYFMALLAWIGAAFGAILLRPVSSLFRRLFKRKSDRPDSLPQATLMASTTQSPAEHGCETPSR
jgi:hypothetical protein